MVQKGNFVNHLNQKKRRRRRRRRYCSGWKCLERQVPFRIIIKRDQEDKEPQEQMTMWNECLRRS
jgi:hypothetical protein